MSLPCEFCSELFPSELLLDHQVIVVVVGEIIWHVKYLLDDYRLLFSVTVRLIPLEMCPQDLLKTVL